MRPNILYLHSHDTGRYVQPYGHAVPTPRIQQFAEEGVLFRQAFSAAPTCSPSRACLLTGRSAHSNGMLGLAHRGFGLQDYTQHLVHTLRRAGYRSTLIGVQHVAQDPTTIGYDEVVVQHSMAGHHNPHPAQKYQNAPSADEVVMATQKFLQREPQEPFFLSVGFYETHREYPEATAADAPSYCLPPPHLPDAPATRQDIAAYHASARILDASIGAILDELAATGRADQTLVILTTDHGLAMPGMKCTLFDRGIGVMLMMRGPGGFSGGRVIDALVSHLDIFPTLCDLLKVERPDGLEGTSILPVLHGQQAEVNDAIFAEVTYHAAYEPQRAVRTPRWKYIRRFGDRMLPVLPNIDDSPSKELWLASGYAERPLAQEQLYDLIFDPQEMNNLAVDPSKATILEEMRSRLRRWMEQTHDPLLRGAVAPPQGAHVNQPDGRSPGEPTQVINGQD